MTSPVLFAYDLDAKGKGTSLAEEDILKCLHDAKLAWAHLDATHSATREWLHKAVVDLDELVLNALLAEETSPRVTQLGDGVLLILRGVNLNAGADPEDMVSIRMWVDDKRIISLERRHVKAIRDISSMLEAGEGPKNAGDFIYQLTAKLFNRMEPVLSQLDDETDDIEERVLDHPDASERQLIVNIRKRAIMFRRYISPQRDVMQYLRTSNISWLDDTHRRHLQEGHDKVARYVEDLDAIRERSQVIKDELVNTLSDRLNKNMYILSVIAAVFLPLGFLTGMLGINVGGIPGADNPNAFWIFGGMLVALVVVQIILFKKLKWF